MLYQTSKLYKAQVINRPSKVCKSPYLADVIVYNDDNSVLEPTDLQFYSSDTHTVYSPSLLIQWDSVTEYTTGSLLSVAGAICCLLPKFGLPPDTLLSNDGLLANAFVTIIATTILIAIAIAMPAAVAAKAAPAANVTIVTPIANTGVARVSKDKKASIFLYIIESSFRLIF